MAWATGTGMRPTSAPNRGHAAVTSTSTPTSTNAPTAAGHPPTTAPVLTSSAAPGVDQARVSGMRWRHESTTIPIPCARHRAASPEPACAGVAPTARSPATTTANELENPTSAVTTPASSSRVVSSRAIRERSIYETIV